MYALTVKSSDFESILITILKSIVYNKKESEVWTMRCTWVGLNQEEIDYHDLEWGKPTHDERYLFEQLMLECQVAGLSWATILKKRNNFRLAFDHFDARMIAEYDEEKIESLMNNKGIIRHRLKIKAMITNAQAYLKMLDEGLSFDEYFWGFVSGEPIINDGISRLTTSELSDTISKDLKRRGFKFVGSTTIYAYLQAVGIINDHDLHCTMRRNYE